ncbi:15113_t:CDS:2, partial [Gigaspora margarita]
FIKTKSRNRIYSDTLSRLEHIKSELQKAILTKKKYWTKKTSTKKMEGLDEINEDIDLVDLEYEKMFAMEEFFNFDAFERDQKAFLFDNNHSTLQSLDSEVGWSIEDIIFS